MNKNLMNEFVETKNALKNIFYKTEQKNEKASLLDKSFMNTLWIFLGKKTHNGFDFDLLLKELKNIHKTEMFQLVKLRWNAINGYLEDDLEKCLVFLGKAYELAVSLESIQGWLINDILIDMRNIQILLNETKNKVDFLSDAQMSLDERKEGIYYPLIDRFESKFNEAVIKELNRHKVATPYTTLLGGLDAVFENIVNVFIISTYYGSLTHLRLVKDRLAKALSSLCFIYDDHIIYVEMLGNYILLQKGKELEQVKRVYNQTTEMINEIDAEKIYRSTINIPIKHKRLISKLIAIEHLGYYFSDKIFSDVSIEIIDEIKDWIKKEERVTSISEYIFKALNATLKRLENDKVAELLIDFFRMGLPRLNDKALETLQLIDFSQIKKSNALLLIENLISLVSDENVRSVEPELQSAILYVRQNCTFKHVEIDECVKKKMRPFYSTIYALSVFDGNETDDLTQIDRLVAKIHKRNKTQGENGVYQGFREDTYKLIGSIIKFKKLKLNASNTNSIIEAIEGTVFAKRQTIQAKIQAIRLLVFLNKSSSNKEELKKVFNRWMEHLQVVTTGREDGIFTKETIETLKFDLQMLKVSFGTENLNKVMRSFATLNQKREFEIIESLKSIENLIENTEYKVLDKIVLTSITQYVIGMSTHREIDIRFYSMIILFSLCKSYYSDTVATQISIMMDNDCDLIKIGIMKRLGILKETNIEIAKLVKQKGEVDNHFYVRKIAGDMED